MVKGNRVKTFSGKWGKIVISSSKIKIVEGSQILGFYFTGSRGFSNAFWAITTSLGGLGFLLTGLSTFIGKICSSFQVLVIFPLFLKGWFYYFMIF